MWPAQVIKHGVEALFFHKGGRWRQVRGSHKFQSASNLEDVYILQPVLHNTKGLTWLLGVIGRTLPRRYKHELLPVIARRHDLGSLPLDNQEHMRLVRGRFQAGIGPIDREARTVMQIGRLAGGYGSPIPLPLLSPRVLPHGLHTMWRAIFQRLLQRLLDLHYICAPRVVRVWGVFGSKRGTRKWVPLEVETIKLSNYEELLTVEIVRCTV